MCIPQSPSKHACNVQGERAFWQAKAGLSVPFQVLRVNTASCFDFARLCSAPPTQAMKTAFGRTYQLLLPELRDTLLPAALPEVARKPPCARDALVEYERLANLVRTAACKPKYSGQWISEPGVREFAVSFAGSCQVLRATWAAVSFAGSAGGAVSKRWAAILTLLPRMASFLRGPAEFVVKPDALRHAWPGDGQRARIFLLAHTGWKRQWCLVRILRARMHWDSERILSALEFDTELVDRSEACSMWWALRLLHRCRRLTACEAPAEGWTSVLKCPFALGASPNFRRLAERVAWYLWHPLQSPHDHALVSRMKLRLAGIRGDGADGAFVAKVAAAFQPAGDAAAKVAPRCRLARRRRGVLVSSSVTKMRAGAKHAARDLQDNGRSLAELETWLLNEAHRLPPAHGVLQWQQALAGKKRECLGTRGVCLDGTCVFILMLGMPQWLSPMQTAEYARKA